MDIANRKLTDHIIEQLTEIQNGKVWIGENFEKKLDSITEVQAFERPAPEMHSVAKILAHLTAWNEDLAQKITQGKGTLLDGDPGNWIHNEVLRIAGWDQIRKKYHDSVIQIIDLLNEKDDAFLDEEYDDQDGHVAACHAPP